STCCSSSTTAPRRPHASSSRSSHRDPVLDRPFAPVEHDSFLLMPVSALARPSHPLPPSGAVWVIDRRNDLAFLIGGALVAFGLLAAHLVFGVSAVVIYMLWVLAIDGPHVFATVSRTYLDPEERATRTRLLRGS